MDKEGDIALIEKALNLEEERYNGYQLASQKVLNEEGKEVLIKLAEVEKKHYKLLKEQISNIKKFEKINLNSLEESEIKLSKKEKNFGRVLSSTANDLAIIQKAENLEEGDAPFYDQLSKETKNNDLKEVFQFLRREEIKHLKVLKSKLKDLENLSSKLSVAKDPRAMFYEVVEAKK